MEALYEGSRIDAMRAARAFGASRGHIPNAEISQAGPSRFEKHQMGLGKLRGSEHDVRPIGNNLAPEFSGRGSVTRAGHQAEGAPPEFVRM